MTFRQLFGKWVVGIVYNLYKDDRKLFLGPARWPRWVLSLLPFNQLFNEPARLHDMGYAGLTKHTSREVIDRLFLRNMFKAIRTSDMHPIVGTIAMVAAITYYCIVRFFGGFFIKW